MAVLNPLSGDGEAPQQYKQPSRKGKKAWRKNVDVSDIQKGLDALNEEIIRGGVIAEKASADLFTIDTVGDASVTKKRTTKALRSDEIIAQRSAVSAVPLRKRPAKTSDGLLPVKRQRKDWVSHAELARLRKVADGEHDSPITVKDASYDIWATPAPDAAPVVKAAVPEEHNFIPAEVKPKPPKTLRHKPISLAASGKSVPAVAKPTGSYSYNPLFDDYAARLQAESDKAVEEEQKRLAHEEADRLKAEATARSAAEADAAEARAEMSEWDEDSAWEGFETEADDDEEGNGKVSARKIAKRKTTVQRNRTKRRKADEGRLKHMAAMKKRDEQVKRIREIAAEVAEREAHRAALVQAKSAAGSDESEEDVGASEVQLRRKKLGRAKLPEGDLELVLPDELEDSLRRLRPEGNLLKDRYRSLLVRGRLEHRRRLPFKKMANVRWTEKWSFKDFRI
ncbi:putative 60S ribosomal biogenesis protein Nop53 [Sodiomyces alkalinus F11]|uniref:Ribosome biogenesis protein NOP53 n=1 Tax=Sodiomyces alkalinus (strain CBS 110278 / VKM F-3762 / F11) TaxID=1314773 RepID=A0A3N2Q521_SODAK|nr:putative 60S ribosomal biogenesis protein Nop53 [Sodiomyces alkalinus F11]ROT41869.1 putative 60S ribosomal biogenesis protein Nop53 [Sodiomyces alkalinus F11]